MISAVFTKPLITNRPNSNHFNETNLFFKKPVANNSKIGFDGYNENFVKPNTNENRHPKCITETYFYRNPETMDFTRDYILKHFPEGIHIADFGCSIGKEAYTLAVMLNKHNKAKKYTITGYDLIPSVIETAKKGEFKIYNDPYENFLFSKHITSPNKRQFKDDFKDCFEQISREMCDEYGDVAGKFLRKTDFDNVVNFQVGDIHNLNRELKLPEKTGAIIFNNAWYHLSGYRGQIPPEQVILYETGQVLENINKALPANGILVVGQLDLDHLYENQPTKFIKQDGKEIEICDSTRFHQLLRRKGFEPVYYEQITDPFGVNRKDGVYLPSVWKKVAEAPRVQVVSAKL